jgi:hypothetical protein
LDRPLPDSLPLALDSEKALLCSCIKSNELVDEPALEPELFALPAHRLIFERLRELFEHGSPIDFVIVKDFLARSGELEQIGGAPYLSDLWDFVPSAANWKHYANVLTEVRTRRLGILCCSELLKELADPATKITLDLTEQFSSIQHRLAATLKADSSSIEVIDLDASLSYQQPADSILLGDCHLVRGNVSVLAGPPGVGKSRAAIALAEAGACGFSWFGLQTKTRFKTFILQNENGKARIKEDFQTLDPAVRDCLFISAPPELGLAFELPKFRRDLIRHLDSFQPDLLVIDPWNAVARDDKAKDYLESFDLIRKTVGLSVAILIVAHTRKPYPGERPDGRLLLNIVHGSYVLGSVPRSVFVLQHASEAVHEDRVVVTNCKNNDGTLAPRGCFRRSSSQWPEVSDFDWSSWDNPLTAASKRADAFNYTQEILSILSGGLQLSKSELVEAFLALRESSGKKCSKSAAYNMFGKKWFKTLVSYSRYTDRFKLR